MIVTNDARLADVARVLRFHGSRDKVSYELLGYNSRLDELQAAILRVQLPHLDDWSDGRRRAAAHYAQAGLGELVTLPRPTLGSAPAWHLYVVRHPKPIVSQARSPRPASAAAPTTAPPCTSSPRCAPGARA